MKYGKIEPVIKWSGSKRSQATDIVSFFPQEIDVYYEPFCGGLSVGMTLALSDKRVNKFKCSDKDNNLIELWKMIKDNPDELIYCYRKHQEQMNLFTKDDVAKMREYYNIIRNTFNKLHNPTEFMFLNRTCFNGLIRYNSNGEFNTPFHLNRKGIEPDKLDRIIKEWSEVLNERNFEFDCCNYEDIIPSENDFVYMDPPYADTKGMYGETFDNVRFFNWLKTLVCSYALSYNGISGNENHTYDIPKELYTSKHLIHSGNSSFKRLKTENTHSEVYESLYIKE